MNGAGNSTKQWPGHPYPLGATWDGKGVNFALFSEHATGVELCLFDSPDAEKESERVRFTEYTDHVWHAYLPEVYSLEYIEDFFGPSTTQMVVDRSPQ